MTRRTIRIALAVGLVTAVGGAAWAILGPGGMFAGASPAPHFVEEAASAGVDHRYDGDFEYFVGGGVAVLDCDADGRPDFYLAGGQRPASLYRNTSPVGGALSFELIRDAATDLAAVIGAYPLDIDSDGVTDLAVLRHGGNVLLHGTGDCRFEPANEIWGVDGGAAWTTAFSATWEGDADLPTLAFGNYLVPDETRRTIECDTSTLVRPEGDRYGMPITLAPGYCTLSMLFSDWDRSGRRDLRVSNDRQYDRDGSEQLWRVEPGAEPRLYGEDDGWQTVRVWGMGIASRDLTGDGRPEIYLTSQADNKLQSLVEPGDGRPRYSDIALSRGVTATRPYTGDDMILPSTAWHPEFADVNNDGLVDLFVAKGNVEAMADYAAADPSNLLIGQADGTFVEGAVEAGIVSFARARGAALTDLNLDGLLDIVVVNRREPVQVWRNLGAGSAEPEPMGNWLALRLKQPAPNRDAVGAWLEIRAGDEVSQIELAIGGGHAGGQLGWIHVGLGDAERATVTATWPDGEVSEPLEVEANGFYHVERGASLATRWQPTDD